MMDTNWRDEEPRVVCIGDESKLVSCGVTDGNTCNSKGPKSAKAQPQRLEYVP
jgi:hypothetical protein